MRDYKPMTDEEREQQRAEGMLQVAKSTSTVQDLWNRCDAKQRLRYEATLQAKDAQIEALALAVLNARAFPDEPKWAEEAHKLAREATDGG